MKYLAVLLLAATLRAADGGQSAAFLKMGVGARELGMGGVATSAPADPYAFYTHPALLAGLESIVLGSQTSFLSEDRSLNYLALAGPSDFLKKRIYYGLSYTLFSLNAPIEVRTTNTADPIGTINDSQYALQFAVAAWALEDKLAVGAGIRQIHESLGEDFGSADSVDLSVLYRITPRLDWTTTLGNLGGSMTWSTGFSDDLALLLRSAVAFRLVDDRMTLAAEIEKNSQQDPRYRLGAEYWNRDKVLAVRLGLDQLAVAGGFGVKFNLWKLGVELDYGVAADPIEAGALAHRFSLSMDWPKPGKHQEL